MTGKSCQQKNYLLLQIHQSNMNGMIDQADASKHGIVVVCIYNTTTSSNVKFPSTSCSSRIEELLLLGQFFFLSKCLEPYPTTMAIYSSMQQPHHAEGLVNPKVRGPKNRN
jgi:hypothetical protein